MSNNKMPSMMALLGLLAVAGYQNRDKISEVIKQKRGAEGTGTPQAASQGLLAEVGSIFGGATGGASLSDAVSGLIEKFRGAGQAQTADSWVAAGDNQDVKPDDLAASLGDDMVRELIAKTGLSRSDILSRLATSLPAAVDQMTPQGRLPSADEAQAHI